MTKKISRLSFIIVIGCIVLPTISYAADEEQTTLVTITSPQKDEVVGSTFEVRYEVQKGITPHYVDIFLDGNYQKDVTSRLNNVKPGPHEIMVKVSVDEEGTRVGWDRVNITVK